MSDHLWAILETKCTSSVIFTGSISSMALGIVRSRAMLYGLLLRRLATVIKKETEGSRRLINKTR